MKVAIIGSGISGITVAKSFIEKNYNIWMFDPNQFKNDTKSNVNFFPSFKKSPKFQNLDFKQNREEFLSKYKIKSDNFFLANTLEIGGLTNHWGGGLEIPDNNYLSQYTDVNQIISEKKNVLSEIGIKEDNYKFYDDYIKNNVMEKFLNFKNDNFYFKKLLLAINEEKYKNKIISNFQYTNKDIFYNAKNEILNLKKYKNFKLLTNSFVNDVIKSDSKLKLVINEKLYNQEFDKVILSCGTIGSSIVVSKLLKINNKIKIFHTPMLQMAYYFNPLISNLNINKEIGLALLSINLKVNHDLFKGSFLSASGINNNFFGVSNSNFIFSLIKKFIFIGNIFFPQKYSDTFLINDGKKTHIKSRINKNVYENIKLIKKNLNYNLSKLKLFEVPFLNCKLLTNGSDAHYTSSLHHLNKNKKILNDKCELKDFKNVHIMDASVIKEGLYYPSLFLMMYIKYVSKKIINDDKKNTN